MWVNTSYIYGILDIYIIFTYKIYIKYCTYTIFYILYITFNEKGNEFEKARVFMWGDSERTEKEKGNDI